MIKILIVDDNQSKIKNIKLILNEIPEVSLIDTSTNIIQAKRCLKEATYDLLILDLGLPLRDGDDPLPKNGIDLLNELNRSSNYNIPAQIIGISEFDDYINQFKEFYEDELWALIKYDIDNNLWETKIKKKIEYLVKFKNNIKYNSNEYDYDVAIITALRHPELESILKLDNNWSSFRLNNDSTEYFKVCLRSNEKNINVVAASAPQMGMVAATNLTSKMINNFRPKYVAMSGIAGGIKGVGNFGDILVADSVFDSGSGKISTDKDNQKIFLPDYRQIDIDSDLKEMILSIKGNREFLDDIKSKWPIKSINHQLDLHIGPFASGAGVIANSEALSDIKNHARKLIGIDMEAYGVYYASKNCSKPRPKGVISLKSISDFGDINKSDDYHEYASYTSAELLKRIILEKLNYD